MSLRPDMIATPSFSDTLPGTFPPTPNEPDAILTSTPYSLSQAVKARRAEYTRQEKVKIKIGSWNVASLAGTEKDLSEWFVQGKGLSETLSSLVLGSDNGDKKTANIEALETVGTQEERIAKEQPTVRKDDPAPRPEDKEIGLYVLGLQEIVDISSASEAFRPFTDPNPGKRWKNAVDNGLPEGYQLVAEQQLIGLYLLIYASPSIAPTIRASNTTSVGTGLMGYMGNKGAVSARIVLGETTKLAFINCHLAAGADKAALDRRNWDAGQILARTRFPPSEEDDQVAEEFGDKIGDEDFGFWFGDLNYRLDDIPGDDVRRLLLLHTKDEYDTDVDSKKEIYNDLSAASEASSIISEGTEATSVGPTDQSSQKSSGSAAFMPLNELPPESNPASLQTTINSLLPHDQLRHQMRQQKAFFDGWREGDIRFLPTYKYDIGSVGLFDSSEKKRSPSWCDRILFRTRRDRLEYEKRRSEEEAAKRKDEEMKARGVDQSAEDDAVLFDYDPEADGADEDYDEDEDGASDMSDPIVVTEDGVEDLLHLDRYASHQRVLSSDHKPLDAVFTLTYDAVVPELKAKIHQQVVRELDRAENEGRPGVTIVVDNQEPKSSAGKDASPSEQTNFQGVNFGGVRYDIPVARSMTVANTGRVPATFSFVDRPVEETQPRGICPPWITMNIDRDSDDDANPSALQEYTLRPGDTVNVILEICITNINHVADLNEGLVNLDDVLVLRVSNGRDHFIPLRATWLPSCFGRVLADLTRAPEGGVRAMSPAPATPNSPISQSSRHFSAPRELFRLTEAIEDLVERSMAEWSMTFPITTPPHAVATPPWEAHLGWPFTLNSLTLDAVELSNLTACVREALDTNTPFQDHFEPEVTSLHRLEALASTLLSFLHSLVDGIIPANIWTTIESYIVSLEKSKIKQSPEESQAFILEALSPSPAHSVSYTFLTFMLARVAAEVAPVSASAAHGQEQQSSPIVSHDKENQPQNQQQRLRPATPTASKNTSNPPSSPQTSTPLQQDSANAKPPSRINTLQTSLDASLPSSLSPLRRARTISSTLSNFSPITPSSPLSFSRGPAVDPAVKRRRDVEKTFAGIFGEAAVKASPPTREKEKRVFEERRSWVIAVFLRESSSSSTS